MEWSEEGIAEERAVVVEADEGAAEAAAIVSLIAAWTSSIFLLLEFCDTIVPLTTKTRFSFLVLNLVFNSMASVTSRNHLTPLVTLGAFPFSQV